MGNQTSNRFEDIDRLVVNRRVREAVALAGRVRDADHGYPGTRFSNQEGQSFPAIRRYRMTEEDDIEIAVLELSDRIPD